MGFGVTISEETPQNYGTPGADNISALILNGVAISGKVALGTTYILNTPSDADALGLTLAYDIANSVLVRYHINEFYAALNNQPTTLYLMLVPQSVELSAILTDTAKVYGYKVWNDAKGQVKLWGFGYNPVTYAPTTANGIDADLIAAIPEAQAFANWMFGNVGPAQVFLEGKGFAGNASSLQDLTALTTDAPKVSVTIAQDLDIVTNNPTITVWEKHAAIGTLLGQAAARAINENLAWVAQDNLTNAGVNTGPNITGGRWINPGFSNNEPIASLQADWSVLDAKHWIFPITYSNINGVYFNNDWTAVAAIVDSEGNINQNNIHYGRTLDKAVRYLYGALIPQVKSPQPADPSTGLLPQGVIAFFKKLGEDAIDNAMAQRNNVQISGRSVTVNPNSNLLTGAKTLYLSVVVVPYGSADTIAVNISLKTTI